MRVLTYKRTHTGDPNIEGIFGLRDCMGQVRGWSYDAVIGVGGIGPKPRSHGIDGRLTWVGVEPEIVGYQPRGPIVKFKRFALFDDEGPSFAVLAPELARRMYERNVRAMVDGYTTAQRLEAEAVIAWAFGPEGRRFAKRSKTLNPPSACRPRKPLEVTSSTCRAQRRGRRPC
jgi:hypothetical protein